MTNQQAPEALAFCWATELAMTQQPVTLSVTEAREVSAEMQRLHAENTALQQGNAAARLEIQSLQARIKTMAEEHADELTVAHLDGRMRVAQPAGAQQPAPSAAAAVSDEDEALDLLATLFDAWENGTPCYEESESSYGFLGHAFRLDDEVLHRCADLLNRRRGKQPSPTPQADSQPTRLEFEMQHGSAIDAARKQGGA